MYQKPPIKFDSSWDDGDPLDVRIIDLLRKYNLPGTFYIPGMDIFSEATEMYKGFEIGGHTVSHPADMKLLSNEEILWEVNENKKILEHAFGSKISKFCYPRGRFDNRVITVLKSLGFESARTTKVLQVETSDRYQTPTAIHVYQRTEYGGVDWLAVAGDMVEMAHRLDGTFHIWGHSWEIERDKNWQKLDSFFNWLTDNYEIVKNN